MTEGKFISVEGIEGVGKSTAVEFIADYLRQHNISCLVTREPGGTAIAEQIRSLLLAEQEEVLSSDTELLLMFASRAQHVAQKIKPALRTGQWVIADRFVDASFAYQGGGRGVPMSRIASLAQWVLGDFLPELTLLLDLPVPTACARVVARGNAKDRFEQEEQFFFQRVRATYLARSQDEKARFRVINADNPLTVVQQALVQAINPLLD